MPSRRRIVRGERSRLALLDGDPGIRVVLRADLRHEGVALVSGGGPRHAPPHGGFLHQGLLTAAVRGDVSATPTAGRCSYLAIIRPCHAKTAKL